MQAVPEVAAVPAGARDAATWYGYLALGAFTYLISIQGNIIPFLKAELDLSYRAVSLHTSGIAVGLLVIGLLGDRLVSAFGRRTMLRVGLLGGGLAMALLTLAPAASVSVATCVLFGLLGAFVPAVVPALLSDIYGERREVAFTESNAVAYAFAIMAPLIAGTAVWAGWNWRVVPLVGTLAAVVIVTAFWRLPVPEGAPPAAGKPATLPPAFWAYWAMLGSVVALEFSVLLWAPTFLETVVGLTPSSAAMGAAAFFVAMLLGRTVGIRLVRMFAARDLFLAAAATTLVGFVAYWGGSSVPAVSIAGLFVVGLGIALTFPLTLGLAIGAAGAEANRASARVMLAPALAILLNPPLLGAIADGAGLRLAQLMVPVFTLLAVAAFLAAGRLGGRPARR
ncbi:MAG: MFS transporter [Bauldia sp.]